MADLYDEDIVLWSEQQAALLRQHAASARVNDAIDWANIIEELADVGRSELRSCRSLLGQALRHMLKAKAWPLCRHAANWRDDAIEFRRQARDAFTPSMRQKIDIAELYADLLDGMPEAMDGEPPLPLPAECEWTLDQLLSRDVSLLD
jgi:hypothetical protein